MSSSEITCVQQWEGDSLQVSRKGTLGKSATLHWRVSGTDSEEKAIKALREHIQKNKLEKYLGMLLQTYQVAERLTPMSWSIDTTYIRPGLKGLDDEEDGSPKEITTYSMSSTSMHVTHSRKTVRKYSADQGVTAPNQGGALCIRDGEAQGTDINISTATVNITHYFKKSQWSTTLRNRILNNGNRMNSSKFRGFEAGELLYLSAQITPVIENGDEYMQVDFTFAYSPNDDDVELADWNGGKIKKEGWNFMWVMDEEDPDTARSFPAYVYIEQMYKTLDFTKLGLKSKE